MKTPLTPLTLAVLLSAAALVGAEEAAAVAAGLQADGYAIVEIERTFLGRARIEATRDGFTREIVVDRSTGEVLRDIERPQTAEQEGGFFSRLFSGGSSDRPKREEGAGEGDRNGDEPDDDVDDGDEFDAEDAEADDADFDADGEDGEDAGESEADGDGGDDGGDD